MRIVWISPFASRSAIGRFSRAVVAELETQGHRVIPVRAETASVVQRQPCDIELSCLCPGQVVEELELADLIVYNLGDNFSYHGYILDLSCLFPGLGILHDASMASLFNGYIHHHNLVAQQRAIIAELYPGEEDRVMAMYQCAEAFWKDSNRFTFLPWVSNEFLGAVVHASFYKSKCEAVLPGSVACIPLCYDALDPLPAPRASRHGKWRVLTIGHVNRNKRAESIVRALAADPALEGSCEYHLVGQINPHEQMRLLHLAKSLGFMGLRIHGHMAGTALCALMERVHAIACLRLPALEGASASVIESMQSARPVLVMDTGCYADLPDELVWKIQPETEIPQIQSTLQEIFSNYPQAIQRAKAAALYSSEYHSAKNYVSLLVPFLLEALGNLAQWGTARTWRKEVYAMAGTQLGIQLHQSLTPLLKEIFVKPQHLEKSLEGKTDVSSPPVNDLTTDDYLTAA